MDDEIDLVSLPRDDWSEMLASAAVLDLVHGGYYRARSAIIQFYCGPEDVPEGWAGDFPDGSPELPRALVGEAEGSAFEADGSVTIRLRVSNWGAVRRLKEAYDRGDYRGRFQQFVLDQEAALRGRSEDRAWLKRQFRKLRAHAAGTLIEG